MTSNTTFDYIICGGGTSGCVLAGRLAEELNASILVLEAGPDSAALENVHMPGGWSNNFETETDWCIETVPTHGLNNRRVKQSRGRLLGGSSGVNGALCVRGTKQDFDDWKIEGWSGEEMFGYMAKAETFHPKPWFKESSKDHGYTGPIHVAPHDNAPISDLVMESFIDRGLPLCEDMFTTGETPQATGHVPRTIFGGKRSFAAEFVRRKIEEEAIIIKCDTTVDQVLLSETSEGLRAVAVDTISKDGTKMTYVARKEIVLSAGPYCSPPILLRSGIGPKTKLEELQIPCQVDIPGVGGNLMDHVVAFMFYETEKPGLTNDHLVWHGDSLATSIQQYQEDKTGFFASFPFGSFAYARLDERLIDEPGWTNAPRAPGRDPMGLAPNQPNIEMWNMELYGGPKSFTHYPVNGNYSFAICAMLFNARSRGSVTIKSNDPLETPVVDHNYLADPLDLLVLTEACNFANEIVMKGKGTKDIVKGSWPPELSHHGYTKREQWVPYVKDTATTCYHASGTCKMGKSDDPLAVLDERLRVRGVLGLRIVDVSVMPTLSNGHTQMIAYAIGQKAADLIAEDVRGCN